MKGWLGAALSIALFCTTAQAADQAWEDCIGNYPQRSIEGCTKVLERGPRANAGTRAIAYNNRGFTYFEMREYDRAIADLDEAIRLDPKLAAAYNNRGLVYHRKGDHSRGIEDINESVRLDPTLAVTPSLNIDVPALLNWVWVLLFLACAAIAWNKRTMRRGNSI